MMANKKCRTPGANGETLTAAYMCLYAASLVAMAASLLLRLWQQMWAASLRLRLWQQMWAASLLLRLWQQTWAASLLLHLWQQTGHLPGLLRKMLQLKVLRKVRQLKVLRMLLHLKVLRMLLQLAEQNEQTAARLAPKMWQWWLPACLPGRRARWGCPPGRL